MRAQINFITIAVQDLKRSVAFFQNGLGFKASGIIGSEFHDEITGADGTIVFIELENGFTLGLYERTNLAKDASILLGNKSSTEFSLGYMAKTKEQVHEFLKKAADAGATLTKEPHERPWGVYSGYIKDIDGHLWEITYDPRIKVEE
jgi:predicted lactoylglutathione lyase